MMIIRADYFIDETVAFCAGYPDTYYAASKVFAAWNQRTEARLM